MRVLVGMKMWLLLYKLVIILILYMYGKLVDVAKDNITDVLFKFSPITLLQRHTYTTHIYIHTYTYTNGWQCKGNDTHLLLEFLQKCIFTSAESL